ncbi:patched domain-containing protein 3-like [Branchiostoma floridae]|uniref:Patched domain-containing protein 3-like n=1 Tax=Branchiostoma floridae TaxID=7739 RepID=A0A9J7MDR9_BRAFL|nr:patched domain-containing protein 3-like [Branchiostoma floridae]
MFEDLRGESVLKESALLEILRFHREAMALEANVSGAVYTFGALCAQHRGTCLENPLLQATGYHGENIANLTVTYPLLSRPEGGMAFLGGALAGLEFQEGELNVVSGAKVFSNTYFLRSQSRQDDFRSKVWLREFTLLVNRFKSDVVRVMVLTDGWLKDATEGKVAEAKQLVTAGLSVLSVFCMLACLRRGKGWLGTWSCRCSTCWRLRREEGWLGTWRRSSPLLGLAGVLSGGFAALSSGGLLGYCGVRISDIAYLAPALVLGVGVDDMFIMLAAWRRTDPGDSLETRAGQALREAAGTITITSLTNGLAFGLGSLSDFPYARTFCGYTALAMLFDYIYQVTFFAALMVFSGKMEYPSSVSLCCHDNVPYSKRQNGGKSAKVSNDFDPSISNDYEDDVTFDEVLLDDSPKGRMELWRERTQRMRMSTIEELDPELEDSEILNDADESLSRRLGRAITSKQTLVWLACVYCTYLFVAGAGFASLEVRDLSRDDWIDRNSPVYAAVECDRKYFSDFYPAVTIVIEGDVDYWNVTTQRSIMRMLSRMEDLDHMNDGIATQTWLRHYISFLKLTRGSSDLGKEEFLRTLKEEFLSTYLFGKYRKDIVFSQNGTIIASRFILAGKGVKGKALAIATLNKNLRDIVDDCPFKASVFSFVFPIFEQFYYVRETMAKNVIAALVSMMLITLLFVPKPVYSLWIGLCILSIDVGVLGFMSLWGISLEPVAVSIFTVSIGFSVDYAAHITVHFAVSQSEGRREKAIRALCEVQLPVVLGAASTALCMLPSGLGSTYVFTLLFKVIILVIVIGCAHGLVFLPAALSVLGPGEKVNTMPSV